MKGWPPLFTCELLCPMGVRLQAACLVSEACTPAPDLQQKPTSGAHDGYLLTPSCFNNVRAHGNCMRALAADLDCKPFEHFIISFLFSYGGEGAFSVDSHPWPAQQRGMRLSLNLKRSGDARTSPG